MKDPGALRDRVAFDRPTVTPDGYGGTETGWSVEPDSHVCSAQFIYHRGSEAVDAARLTGRGIYKLRIRNTVKSREITPAWRMRDLRRGAIYNVREVDTVTDRGWVYIVVERGVAV